jgi:hypothetical protein
MSLVTPTHRVTQNRLASSRIERNARVAASLGCAVLTAAAPLRFSKSAGLALCPIYAGFPKCVLVKL